MGRPAVELDSPLTRRRLHEREAGHREHGPDRADEHREDAPALAVRVDPGVRSTALL
jgi:hypothetical protein